MRTGKMMAMLGGALLAASAMAAPSVEITAVQQQYPWTNTVDITYEVQGVTNMEYFVRFTPTTSDDDPILNTAGEASIQVALESNGVFTAQWYPQTNLQYTACKMTPAIFRGGSGGGRDYMIVDLQTGEVTYEPMATQEASNERYTSDLAYRKTKMVFRKVAAGPYDVFDGAKVATMEKDYYIGIFEVTEAQYNRILDSGDFASTASMKPKVNVSWNAVRGNALPGASVVANRNGGVIARLKYKTGLNFDLPNSAMHEVAARAGCPKNWVRWWGTATRDDATGLGEHEWYDAANKGVNDGFGFTSGVRVVGTRKANAWGLYDVLSNAREMCRDATGMSTGSDSQGSYGNYDADQTFTQKPYTTGANRIIKAGGSFDPPRWLRCSSHWSNTAGFSDGCTGFRLALIVE